MLAIKIYILSVLAISWLSLSVYYFMSFRKTRFLLERYRAVMLFAGFIGVIIYGIFSPDSVWISILQMVDRKVIYLVPAIFLLLAIAVIVIKVTEKTEK